MTKPLILADLTPGYYWARHRRHIMTDLSLEVVELFCQDAWGEDSKDPMEYHVELIGTSNSQSAYDYDLFQKIEPPEIAL